MMKHFQRIHLATLTIALVLVSMPRGDAQVKKPRFHVVVIAEKGGIHLPFVDTAKAWLNRLAADSNFSVDYIQNTDKINSAFLAHCQLFIQLNYPPYMWTDTAKAAFQNYIEEGKGGWIGFHHATLLGEFDGYKMWPWFSKFMGGIRYTNYIASFVAATVHIEDRESPYTKNVDSSFTVATEEWYTYDKSPRSNVHVLASVDEGTYKPDTKIKMGDHPVVWSNEQMRAKNIYIFMGHHPNLFRNSAYTTLFKNSIFFAAKR